MDETQTEGNGAQTQSDVQPDTQQGDVQPDVQTDTPADTPQQEGIPVDVKSASVLNAVDELKSHVTAPGQALPGNFDVGLVQKVEDEVRSFIEWVRKEL